MSYFDAERVREVIRSFCKEHPELDEDFMTNYLRFKSGYLEPSSPIYIAEKIPELDMEKYLAQGYDRKNAPRSNFILFNLQHMTTQCGMAIMSNIGGMWNCSHKIPNEIADKYRDLPFSLAEDCGYSQVIATMPVKNPILSVMKAWGFIQLGEEWKNYRSLNTIATLQWRIR